MSVKIATDSANGHQNVALRNVTLPTRRLPPFALAAMKPTPKGWTGYSPLWAPQRFGSSRVSELEM